MRRFLKYLFIVLITGVLVFACNTINTNEKSVQTEQDSVLIIGSSPKVVCGILMYLFDKDKYLKKF